MSMRPGVYVWPLVWASAKIVERKLTVNSTKSKHYKLWLILAGVCLVLAVASAVAMNMAHQTGDLATSLNFQTGMKNYSVLHNEATGYTLVGTQQNKLLAYDAEGNEAWSFEGKSVFRDIVQDEAAGLAYAGCEDSNIYVLDIQSGELKNTINIGRRLYALDLSDDGSKLAISGYINASKSYVMVYDAKTGEELSNIKVQSAMQGITFSSDGNVVYGNNQGRVVEVDLEGEKIKETRVNYEIVSFTRNPNCNYYIVGDKNAEYTVLDMDLNVVRHGVAQGEELIGSVAAIDNDGEYTMVGTESGFLFVFDSSNKNIFTTRLSTVDIKDIEQAGDQMLITGVANFLYSMDIGSLSSSVLLSSLGVVFIVLLLVFGTAVIVFLFLGVPPMRRFAGRFFRAVHKHRIAYLMLIPTFVLIAIFCYYPMFTALTRAFTNWSRDNYYWYEIKFVGFDNFVTMWTEGYFLTGLKNMFILLITGLAKLLTIPVLLAWLVFSMKNARQKYVFRFLFVLPMVVPGLVSTLMWKQMFDPTIGALNQILAAIGHTEWQQVWLAMGDNTIWTVVLMGFPWVNAMAFLVFYGGMLDIDASLLEAAKVDGSNRWKDFWFIILPLIKPQLKIMIILTFIGCIQDYGGIFLLTQGGPGTATYVPGLELYYNATKFGRYGYACALGLVMFVAIMICTLIQMRLKSGDEN